VGQASAVQADGDVGHVEALRVRSLGMQAAAEGGERSTVVLHVQEGRRGEALQSADLDVEAARIGRLQCGKLRGDPLEIEFVVCRAAGPGRKAAQRERDVRLACVAVEQQAGQRVLRRGHPCPHCRGVHVERPQQVVRPAASPRVEVTPLVAYGERRGEKLSAQEGGVGHRPECPERCVCALGAARIET